MKVGPFKFSTGGETDWARYANGETALIILSDRGVEAKATTNVEPYGAHLAGPEYVWLKGWGENEGLPEALVEAGVVELTGETFLTGHAEAILAKLTPEALAELEETRS